MTTSDDIDQPSCRAWLIFGLCCLFYFYQYILQVSPDALSGYLQHDFAITEHILGRLSAAFFFAYTLVQIPAGMLLDRFGSQRLLTIASLLCTVGALMFAVAPHIYFVTLARLMMGFGSAFAYIGALNLVTQWFATQRFTFLAGILLTIGMMGGMIGETPLVRVIAVFGWRPTMLSLGLAGAVISLLIFLLVRNGPKRQTVKVHSDSPLSALKRVVKKPQLWLVSIFTSIITIPWVVLCSLYGIPFLTTTYGVSETMAGRLISLILLGVGIGSPVWGRISDHSLRRLPPLIVAAIATPLLLLAIIYYPFSHLIGLALLLFAFGFFASANLSAFSIACEINKPSHVATALGFINGFDTLGATIALPLLGLFLDLGWSGSLNHGLRLYSAADYRLVFTGLAVLTAVPIGFLPFIRETYAQNQTEN